jgi:hypothetical protein
LKTINLLGQTIHNGIIKNSVVNVNKLEVTLYFIDLNGGEKIIRKFMKQ